MVAKRSEFVDWLLEQMAPLGNVSARAMFGAFGIYLDDFFFALVHDDTLYLKADQVNKPRFLKIGAQPFRYHAKGGKVTEMSYFQPPESALDDCAELIDWARASVDAALRARSAGSSGKSKRHTV